MEAGSVTSCRESSSFGVAFKKYADLDLTSSSITSSDLSTQQLIDTNSLSRIPPPMPLFNSIHLKSIKETLSTLRSHAAAVTDAAVDTKNSSLSVLDVFNSTVNHLYDNELSSCSTAYESICEFVPANEHSSFKVKSNREVYEDAEALYKHLKPSNFAPTERVKSEANIVDGNNNGAIKHT